jgi:hypothetical protein
MRRCTGSGFLARGATGVAHRTRPFIRCNWKRSRVVPGIDRYSCHFRRNGLQKAISSFAVRILSPDTFPASLASSRYGFLDMQILVAEVVPL